MLFRSKSCRMMATEWQARKGSKGSAHHPNSAFAYFLTILPKTQSFIKWKMRKTSWLLLGFHNENP
jgi:hypothetical protein